MQYHFRPHLFIKQETLMLGDQQIEHLRNGHLRRTIDLRTVRRVQEYNSGMLLDDHGNSVPGVTCRLHLASGWPLMFRSTSYLGPGSKTAPRVKDQTGEFLAFYRSLLRKLESLDPDLPVVHGSRGYVIWFLLVGLVVLTVMAGLCIALMFDGDGTPVTRWIVGPSFLLVGIGFCYMVGKWVKIYRPERKTVREVLQSL